MTTARANEIRVLLGNLSKAHHEATIRPPATGEATRNTRAIATLHGSIALLADVVLEILEDNRDDG